MKIDNVRNNLINIIEMTKKFKFNKTKRIFIQELKRYDNKNVIKQQMLLKGENMLISEFCNRDISYEKSYKIFEKIIIKVYGKRLKSGKKVNLLKDETGRLDKIENSLGILFQEIQSFEKKKSRKSKKNFMFLLCLAHILRYEAYASSNGFIRKKMVMLIDIGMKIDKKKRDQLIEDFFTIRKQGSEGKADITHIRNSVAHGRFEFINDNTIKFTDIKSGKKTFEITLNDGDLVGLFNMFEMKLKFVILYSIFIQLLFDIKRQNVNVI